MDVIDFGPATHALSRLVLAVTDAHLADPTPCADYTVADLCDHVGGLALAFTAAADKQRLPDAAPHADGTQLEPQWRHRVSAQLAALAQAWTRPAAYEGLTQAVPIDLPAAVAARVALNEVVVHGWDLARAVDVAYDADPQAVATCLAFVESFEPPADGPASEGALYGPPVDVAPDAPPLHRLLGLTGRRPG